MKEVKATAPAKINWTLEVLGRRDDGFHELRTVFQTVGLCDIVTVREAAHFRFEVSGVDSGLHKLPITENLAYKAWDLMSERLRREEPIEIVIEKNIPAAAGLGGGSSDAAAVLRALPALWGVDVERYVLREVAAELGSDVPFFVECGSVLAAGRGDELTILAEAPRKDLVLLLLSGVKNKTAEVYGALLQDDFRDGAQSIALALIFTHRLEYGDANLCNSFERAAQERYQEQAPAVAELEKLAGRRSHLAGSGPSRFVIADDEDHGRWLASALQGRGFASASCRTLASVEALGLEVSD